MPSKEFKAVGRNEAAGTGVSIRLSGFQDLVYTANDRTAVFEYEPLVRNETIFAYIVIPSFGWTWQPPFTSESIAPDQQAQIESDIREAAGCLGDRVYFEGDTI